MSKVPAKWHYESTEYRESNVGGILKQVQDFVHNLENKEKTNVIVNIKINIIAPSSVHESVNVNFKDR